MQAKQQREPRGPALTAIAVFKLFKVSALILVGGAALVFAHASPALDALARWSAALGPERELLHRLLDRVSHASDDQLHTIGFGGLAYALVFSAEGIGLWRQKIWAEYLTVFVTISFIPFEIYELVDGFSAGKVAGLVVNVVILVYLVLRLIRQRRRAH